MVYSHQQEKHPFSKRSTRAGRDLPEKVHRHLQVCRYPRCRLIILLISASKRNTLAVRDLPERGHRHQQVCKHPKSRLFIEYSDQHESTHSVREAPVQYENCHRKYTDTRRSTDTRRAGYLLFMRPPAREEHVR